MTDPKEQASAIKEINSLKRKNTVTENQMSQRDLLQQTSNRVAGQKAPARPMSSFAMLGSKLLQDGDSEESKSGVSSRPDSQYSRDEEELISRLPKQLKSFV